MDELFCVWDFLWPKDFRYGEVYNLIYYICSYLL